MTVTFVQIGNDSSAEEYLGALDGATKAECAANGETFDLVDTIKHAEMDAAMAEIKGTKSSGKNGALFGAFAGAALGVGGECTSTTNNKRRNVVPKDGVANGKSPMTVKKCMCLECHR